MRVKSPGGAVSFENRLYRPGSLPTTDTLYDHFHSVLYLFD